MQITGGTEAGYSSVALHPDGQILGTGTEDATVHVWETKSQNVSLPLLLVIFLHMAHATVHVWETKSQNVSLPLLLFILLYMAHAVAMAEQPSHGT